MTKLIQYSGLLGTFLITCGALKFYIYYKMFNISILRFFEFQEILTLFLDNILAYLGVLVFTTIFILLLHSNIESDLKSNSISTISLLLGQKKLIIGFIIFALLCVIFYYFKTKGVNVIDFIYLVVLILICFIFLPFLYIYMYKTISHLNNNNLQFEDIYFSLFSTLLVFYTVFTAYNEAKKVKQDHYYKGVTIIFNDLSKFESSDSEYFIGSSKNYVYTYSEISKAGTVHSISNVKSIIFP